MFLSDKPASTVVTRELLLEIKKRYKLDWYGLHGVYHWARVYDNGMKLAAGQEGVNQKVVQLFAAFHDAQRLNEGCDYGHGERGAELACRLRHLLNITDDEFSLLTEACRLHTSERTHADITLQVCFDADRLDIGRVGKVPDPHFLSSPRARKKEMIECCYARSLKPEVIPSFPFGLDLSRDQL